MLAETKMRWKPDTAEFWQGELGSLNPTDCFLIICHANLYVQSFLYDYFNDIYQAADFPTIEDYSDIKSQYRWLISNYKKALQSGGNYQRSTLSCLEGYQVAFEEAEANNQITNYSEYGSYGPIRGLLEESNRWRSFAKETARFWIGSAEQQQTIFKEYTRLMLKLAYYVNSPVISLDPEILTINRSAAPVFEYGVRPMEPGSTAETSPGAGVGLGQTGVVHVLPETYIYNGYSLDAIVDALVRVGAPRAFTNGQMLKKYAHASFEDKIYLYNGNLSLDVPSFDFMKDENLVDWLSSHPDNPDPPTRPVEVDTDSEDEDDDDDKDKKKGKPPTSKEFEVNQLVVAGAIIAVALMLLPALFGNRREGKTYGRRYQYYKLD